MLGLVVLLIILLGYSLFFRELIKIEFSHALVFSFSTIISLYFIAAIFNILDATIYCSFVLGIGLFIYVILDFLRHDTARNICKILTYDVIIFVVAVVTYFISIRGLLTYAFWDEYSFWGIAAKGMNINHGLSFNRELSSNMFGQYAQLASIFQYSISKLIGFKEAHNVFANGLMLIIFSSVALVEKRLFWSITLPLITILPSLFFNIVSLNSLHLDGTIGMLFGATIAVYIQSAKYNSPLFRLILIMPLMFILPNIKEVGYWFAYMTILIIIVDQYSADRSLLKNRRYVVTLLALSLLPLLSKLLWCFLS